MIVSKIVDPIQMIELRFFGQMSLNNTADALDHSFEHC